MNKIVRDSAQSKQPLWLFHSMIKFYCNNYHCKGKLCKECEALVELEEERSRSCVSCCSSEAGCTRQCYPTNMRLQIHHIIRWAEPKLRWRKPFLRVRYMLRGANF